MCSTPGCDSPPVLNTPMCGGCLAARALGESLGDGPPSLARDLARGALPALGPRIGRALHLLFAPADPVHDEASRVVEAHSFVVSLGFSPAAEVPTVAEVEAFRRRLARAYHADGAAGAPVAPDMLARINAACDTLAEALEE